jgi:hypothetical protein
MPQGGAAIFPALQSICQQELGWSAECWVSEQTHYQEVWQRCYSLPPLEQIPPWREPVRQALAARAAQPSLPRRALRPTLFGLVLVGLGFLGYGLYRRSKQK